MGGIPMEDVDEKDYKEHKKIVYDIL